jgi:hypothetical protein
VEQSLKFDFKASNNLGVYKVTTKSDSQLLTNHVSGTYQVKDEMMDKYVQVT